MSDQALELDTNRSPVAQYLDIQAFVNFCIKNKLEAAHPGYGSLAENENFAKALEANGIVFCVGPTVEKSNTQYVEQPSCEVQCWGDDADKAINLWVMWF